MKKVKKQTIINSILITCMALVLFLFYLIDPYMFLSSADGTDASTTYTDVLTDLKKDENFDIGDYPSKADDHSLSVITIAESKNLQVFVYVYQPSYKENVLNATSINISTTIDNTQ